MELKKNEKNKMDKFSGAEFSNSEVTDLFKTLIQAKKEYEITKEVEATKRKNIESSLYKYLSNLEAKKELIYYSLAEEYSIRRENIDKMFSLIEESLENDKDNVVIAALDNIEKIICDSPLKSIAEIAKAFNDDDSELII
jgi:hypothetical protein